MNALGKQILSKINQVPGLKFKNFKMTDKMGWSVLVNALFWDGSKALSLGEDEFDYLIKNSELNPSRKKIQAPLFYLLSWYGTRSYNLSEKQIFYFIKNSDLKKVDVLGYNALMYYLKYTPKKGRHLNEKIFDYLIENSNLQQKSINGYKTSALSLAVGSGHEASAIKIIKKMLADKIEIDDSYYPVTMIKDWQAKTRALVEMVKTELKIEKELGAGAKGKQNKI